MPAPGAKSKASLQGRQPPWPQAWRLRARGTPDRCPHRPQAQVVKRVLDTAPRTQQVDAGPAGLRVWPRQSASALTTLARANSS